MIPWLRPEHPPEAFPPVEEALQEPNGLLCVGGDLSAERLLEAYRRGIFPWFSAGQPILWWSPDPRTVLYPGEFKVSRSLGKTLRNRGFRTTGRPGLRAGHGALRRPGAASRGHLDLARRCTPPTGACTSSATRTRSKPGRADQLVGGLYGVALGRVFFGESMFSVARDASKVALHALVQASLAQNVRLIDCQVDSAHLRSLGARSVPRREFMRELAAATRRIAARRLVA